MKNIVMIRKDTFIHVHGNPVIMITLSNLLQPTLKKIALKKQKKNIFKNEGFFNC
jgi:hypothetical protein